jgi:hypothetical protein
MTRPLLCEAGSSPDDRYIAVLVEIAVVEVLSKNLGVPPGIEHIAVTSGRGRRRFPLGKREP